MFKVIGYLDEWEDLYVSRHASRLLRAYRGKEGVRDGRDGEFVITDLGYVRSSPDERPRLVQLFTLATQPWAALLIGSYLRSQAGEAIDGILKGGSRSSLSKQISVLFKACEQIDSQLGLTADNLEGATKIRKERPPGKLHFGSGLVFVLSLLVSAGLLLKASTIRDEIENLKKNQSEGLAKLAALREANGLLQAENKSLRDATASLAIRRDRAQEAIAQLEGVQKELERKNSVLKDELGVRTDKLRKFFWSDLIDTETRAALSANPLGLTKAQVVDFVALRLPPAERELIEERLDALTKDAQIEIRIVKRTFSSAACYFLKNPKEK